MNMQSLINIVACLFLLLALGYLARRLRIIDDALSKGLSRLIIRIGQPALIINSLIRQPYSTEEAGDALRILLLGFILHAFMALCAYAVCRPIRDLDERKLSEFSLIFANCGFIGFPILESVLGDRGLFWGAFYLISFHTLIWTLGILILARGRGDIRPRMKDIFLNFGTIPCAVGLAVYFSRLPIPDFLLRFTDYVASLCTPISMLITGALLATLPLKSLLCSGKLYLLSLHKLILLPVAVSLLMHLCGFDADYVRFAAVMAAMPSGSVITMYGETYGIKPAYAALTVGISSLLSVLSIPVVMWITEQILH